MSGAGPVNAPLSAAAQRGWRIFFNLNPASPPEVAGSRGNCAFCHSGSLLSEASVESIAANGRLRQTGNPLQFSDRGTRNIGVRAATEDLGAGGEDPFGNPLSLAVQQALPSGGGLAVDGIPHGHPGNESAVLQIDQRAVDTFMMIPAVGRAGADPLPGFLED